MLEAFEVTEYCQFRRTFHSILIHNLPFGHLDSPYQFQLIYTLLSNKTAEQQKILPNFYQTG